MRFSCYATIMADFRTPLERISTQRLTATVQWGRIRLPLVLHSILIKINRLPSPCSKDGSSNSIMYSISVSSSSISHWASTYVNTGKKSSAPYSLPGSKGTQTVTDKPHFFYQFHCLKGKHYLFCCLHWPVPLYYSRASCYQCAAERTSSDTHWAGDQHQLRSVLLTSTNLVMHTLRHAREFKDWAHLGISSTGKLIKGCHVSLACTSVTG